MVDVKKVVEFVSRLIHVQPVRISSYFVLPISVEASYTTFSYSPFDDVRVDFTYEKEKGRTVIEVVKDEKTVKRYVARNVVPLYILGGLTFTTSLPNYECESSSFRVEFKPNTWYCIPLPQAPFEHLTLTPHGFDYLYFYSNFKPEPERKERVYELKVGKGRIEVEIREEKPFNEVSLKDLLTTENESVVRSQSLTVKYSYSGLTFIATPFKLFFKFGEISSLSF